MSAEPTVSISYFSDVLCVWAYFAQIKLDQIRQDFGPQVQLRHHFIPVFGDVEGKIEGSWKERGGMEGYSRHVHQLAERFPHASIHPEVWKSRVPASSASCHLLLKAAQLLESAGEISPAALAGARGQDASRGADLAAALRVLSRRPRRLLDRNSGGDRGGAGYADGPAAQRDG